jgi:hypothetical protein
MRAGERFLLGADYRPRRAAMYWWSDFDAGAVRGAFAARHAHLVYATWAEGPRDPDPVPFTCAPTTARCGEPPLTEEFGGCTAPAGAPSREWRWTAYGQPRAQSMAAEDDPAADAEALRRVAATEPRVHWPPRRAVRRVPSADEYYAAPREHCVRLYDAYPAG